MSGAATFTIYKLHSKTDDFEGDCNYIINEYDKSNNDGVVFESQEKAESPPFTHITDFYLYVGIKTGPPEWKSALEAIVPDLNGLTNRQVSFVLFIEYNEDRFCITGGSGRFVVAPYIDYYFGLEVLSRVLEENESYIKETQSRYLAGNQISGQSQFHEVVSIESTRTLTNYFKHVNSFLPKDKIEEHFGIDLKNGRKEYKFLASDSLKLGKALTMRQIDIVIFKLCELLKQTPRIEINHIRPIRKQDPLSRKLDMKLNEVLKSKVVGQSSSSRLTFVLPTYSVDYFVLMTIQNHKEKRFDNINDEDIFNYCREKFPSISVDTSKNYVNDFLENVKVNGRELDTNIFELKLYDCLEVSIEMTEVEGEEQETKLYWLMDGEWFFYEDTMEEVVDREFLNKVVQAASQSSSLGQIKPWQQNNASNGEKISEGDYNLSHQSVEDMYVLDKILVSNVEMCDLLLLEENKVYFIHVKDGLERDVRVLCNQILNAMKIVQLARTHGRYEAIENYYNNIVNKIGEENNSETNLSRAARKFRRRFGSQIDFVKFIKNIENEIIFVFAFRPGATHDLKRPTTIKSFPAKFSMIHLVEELRKFDFRIEFKEIKVS